MNEAVVIVTGSLCGAVVLLAAALVWLAFRLTGRTSASDRVLERQDRLIRSLADRLMAGDWANLVAGEQGQTRDIDRRHGTKIGRGVPARNAPSAARDSAAAQAPGRSRTPLAADDNMASLGPLVADPALEEDAALPVGR
ncbi:MAG: hypothetical protein ABIG68_13600 [Acidobacteriota bacterium]